MPRDKKYSDPFDPDTWLNFIKKFGLLVLFLALCTIALFAWGFVELISWITSK